MDDERPPPHNSMSLATSSSGMAPATATMSFPVTVFVPKSLAADCSSVIALRKSPPLCVAVASYTPSPSVSPSFCAMYCRRSPLVRVAFVLSVLFFQTLGGRGWRRLRACRLTHGLKGARFQMVKRSELKMVSNVQICLSNSTRTITARVGGGGNRLWAVCVLCTGTLCKCGGGGGGNKLMGPG